MKFIMSYSCGKDSPLALHNEVLEKFSQKPLTFIYY